MTSSLPPNVRAGFPFGVFLVEILYFRDGFLGSLRAALTISSFLAM